MGWKLFRKSICSLIAAAMIAPSAAFSVSAENESETDAGAYEELLSDEETNLAEEETAALAEEEERRAEEEARLAEEEELREEEEARLAELEENAPPVMSEEEAEKRRAAIKRQTGNVSFDADSQALFGAADSSEYSEIVYISTAEELRAIDGHEGGYYELTDDIDLSGSEWEPLLLYDATFNGNGHTISGVTITKEPEEKTYKITFSDGGGGTYTETTTLTPDVAFLFGENNYIANLTLDNASIDVTITTPNENFKNRPHSADVTRLLIILYAQTEMA